MVARHKLRRRRFKVGVRKEYYPRETWPKEFGVSYIEIHNVLAFSRTEAANTVWNIHGERLLKVMLPNRRKISLDVDEPLHKPGGNLGRLVPITVYVAKEAK